MLSAPYVIIGMMHVSTSFHIIAIFNHLKFKLIRPAVSPELRPSSVGFHDLIQGIISV